MTDYSYQTRETLLKISGVSMTRGEALVLRDVDLEIKNLVRPGLKQGQIVALVGPSGCGKTTLFRLLAGHDAPDSGTISIGAAQKPVERGAVGVVAQHYPLLAHRSVLGNLLVAGRQVSLKRAENRAKAEELLARFGLAGQAEKYPAQLSGGQRQRVAIAQQFMGSDGFLLMDEPFSGLDMLAQESVIALIQEMAQRDELMTFILITHDINAALQVADTVWVLGREQQQDGQSTPGARIRATFDLAARGLAWHENIVELPEFSALRQEIRALFPTL